jgi:hypothetical protein
MAQLGGGGGFNPLDLLNPLAIGGGILGALFGGGGDEQEEIYELLKQRGIQGIDPKLLAAMKRKAVGSVGNEFSALSAQAQSRLRRGNAPVAIQEQVLGKLATRRAGARTDALTGIDALNEQTKSGALGQLSQFGAGMNTGQGFSDLIGAGFGGLQQQLAQDEYFKQLDMILNNNTRRS